MLLLLTFVAVVVVVAGVPGAVLVGVCRCHLRRMLLRSLRRRRSTIRSLGLMTVMMVKVTVTLMVLVLVLAFVAKLAVLATRRLLLPPLAGQVGECERRQAIKLVVSGCCRRLLLLPGGRHRLQLQLLLGRQSWAAARHSMQACAFRHLFDSNGVALGGWRKLCAAPGESLGLITGGKFPIVVRSLARQGA